MDTASLTDTAAEIGLHLTVEGQMRDPYDRDPRQGGRMPGEEGEGRAPFGGGRHRGESFGGRAPPGGEEPPSLESESELDSSSGPPGGLSRY